MGKLSDSDLDLLDSALLDAMEYMRTQEDDESKSKNEAYKKLYQRLFVVDEKAEVK